MEKNCVAILSFFEILFLYIVCANGDIRLRGGGDDTEGSS